jgi:hypothetical protein
MEIIGLLYSIFKAIPILDYWVKELIKHYVAKEKEWASKALAVAIDKGVLEGDQRDAEKQMGSNKAGKPVNQAGSEIVDKVGE